MGDQQLIADYREKLFESGLKLRTVDSYSLWAKGFLGHIEGKSLERLTSNDLANYTDHLLESGKSNNTVVLAATSVKKFVKLMTNGKVAIDTHIGRVQTKQTRILTEDELVALFNNVPGEARLAMVMIYVFGLRRQQVFNIRIVDCDLGRRALSIYYEHRPSDPVIHEIPECLLQALENQIMRSSLNHEIDALNGHVDAESSPYHNLPLDSIEMQHLFPGVRIPSRNSTSRKPLDATYAKKKLVIASNRCNFNKIVTTTDLRYAAFSHYLKAGSDIEELSELFGFQKIESAAIMESIIHNSVIKSHETHKDPMAYVLNNVRLTA